jgi:hypothetical protein
VSGIDGGEKKRNLLARGGGGDAHRDTKDTRGAYPADKDWDGEAARVRREPDEFTFSVIDLPLHLVPYRANRVPRIELSGAVVARVRARHTRETTRYIAAHPNVAPAQLANALMRCGDTVGTATLSNLAYYRERYSEWRMRNPRRAEGRRYSTQSRALDKTCDIDGAESADEDGGGDGGQRSSPTGEDDGESDAEPWKEPAEEEEEEFELYEPLYDEAKRETTTTTTTPLSPPPHPPPPSTLTLTPPPPPSKKKAQSFAAPHPPHPPLPPSEPGVASRPTGRSSVVEKRSTSAPQPPPQPPPQPHHPHPVGLRRRPSSLDRKRPRHSPPPPPPPPTPTTPASSAEPSGRGPSRSRQVRPPLFSSPALLVAAVVPGPANPKRIRAA